MIDKGIPDDRDGWPEGTLLQLRSWEQGDLVREPLFFYFADPAKPIWGATRLYSGDSSGPEIVVAPDEFQPPYGLVTSQTCDIAEEDSSAPVRPWVQVAPVYEVTDSGWKKKLRKGGGPRYWLYIPGMSQDQVWAADLRIEFPVEKGWLAEQERIVAHTEDQRLLVAERLSWARGRPAFTREFNEAVVWPLQEELDRLEEEAESAQVIDEIDDKTDEVVVLVDSVANPSAAQVVLLLREELSEPAIARLEDWQERAAAEARQAGIELQAMDYRLASEVTLLEYRRMLRIR